MNITFQILGFEVARINLDIDLGDVFSADAPQATPVDKAIGRVSAWWVKRGMK